MDTIKLKPWMVSLLCLMIALPLVAQSSISGVPTTSNDLLDPSRVDEACGDSIGEDADEGDDNDTDEGNAAQNQTEDDDTAPPDDDDNPDEDTDTDEDTDSDEDTDTDEDTDEDTDTDEDGEESDDISGTEFMEYVDQNSDNFATWAEIDDLMNELGGWDTDAERTVAMEEFQIADENNDSKLNTTELEVWLSSSALADDDDDDGNDGFIPCERRVHRVEHMIMGGLNIIGHMIGGSFMMLSAILTFNSDVLRKRKRLHRIAGYTFITGGALIGISAVSMTVLFPHRFEPFLRFTNILWGGLLLVAITIAFRAAVQKKFKIHRAWMIRAYLVAAGPSFHRWFFLLGFGVDSDVGDFFVSLAALIVGELIIRNIGLTTLRDMIQLRGGESKETQSVEAMS